MKEADPIKFGGRVRERRVARGLSQARLGKLAGYSQTNIGWIEKGTMKRPHVSAGALSEALMTPVNICSGALDRRKLAPRS
jgi:transcriptional regulator with XRE-family HTH domain